MKARRAKRSTSARTRGATDLRAREQQLATTEILEVISSSPSSVQPVFDAIIRSAVRLGDAQVGTVFRLDGNAIHVGAHCNLNTEAEALFQRVFPQPLNDASPYGRAMLQGAVVNVADLERSAPSEASRQRGRVLGTRAVLAVPMLAKDGVLGAIVIGRRAPGAFSESYVSLLQTFAAQAVIAIENVRLFNETKESLEQQTATAEILKVISSSLTDIQPVLDVVAASAARLCEADDALIQLREAEELRFVAHFGDRANLPPRPTRPVIRGMVTGRSVIEGRQIHIHDYQKEDAQYPEGSAIAREFGFHTMLVTPLMRAGNAIGTIFIRRREVKPFSEKQMALVKTFADQAVIAIENVRLFNETREALERQTATAEILKVIAASPSDVQPVFDAIIKHAARLAAGCSVNVSRLVGDQLHLAAYTPVSPTADEVLRNAYPVHVGEARPLAEAVHRKEAFFVSDFETDPTVSRKAREVMRARGFRSTLYVPILLGDVVHGVMHVSKVEPGPFPQQWIDLLKTFADQAVIAIENVRLFKQTKEALEKQTAISEILRVISASPTDVQPVFETIIQSAARLCNSTIGAIFRYDGELIHYVAGHNFDAGGRLEAIRTKYPARVDNSLLSGRVIQTLSVVRIDDAARDPDYDVQHASLGGWRRMLGVPMLKDGAPLGVIVVAWDEPGVTPESQEQLLSTFADQAVIAIENVRLFNETKEALEQQTAISDILQVISNSPTDVRPVLSAVAERAARLCDAEFVTMLMADGALLRATVNSSLSGEGLPDGTELIRIDRTYIAGRAAITGKTVHVEDVVALMDSEFPGTRDNQKKTGYRTFLAVPLMRDKAAIGVIAAWRRVVRPFSDKQVALLETFADQAALAIENVRLFNETKEALERQTATSEVLKVISQTRIDLQPVLEIVLENARKLCSADRVIVLRPDADGSYRPAAIRVSEHSSDNVTNFQREPIRVNRATAAGRALLERRAIHIPDALADPEYGRPELIRDGGWRSILAVPMLREGLPIGVLTVSRVGDPKPFTDKQIELVTTFADQAVIAIENVRLFNETNEALEQLKASAEVLRVISSSVEDTQPVFDAILESCQRLFEGRIVGITTVGEDEAVHLAAYEGPGREGFEEHFPIPLSRESGSGVVILERRVVHYPDIEAPGVPEYARRGSRLTGTRSVIFAPMLWEERGIGAIFVGREWSGPFSAKDVALLKTFADQAVIAIQNARLFREIHEKSRQLEVANRHKSEFLANMSHELRTPLNAIIGFTRIVMRRSKEQLEPKQYENLEKIHSSGQHLLALINAILDLSKVEAGHVEVHAADVALGPVLEQCVRTVEPLVKTPAVRLLKEFDGELPRVFADEEKLRQIVINLLSNAAKFTERGTVRVHAKRKGDYFAVAVADTGVGIPGDKLEHVFEEFAQADASSTRVYGGTGLGLTIARRLARLMGGDIAVQSAPGSGSTFTLTLPLRYEARA